METSEQNFIFKTFQAGYITSLKQTGLVSESSTALQVSVLWTSEAKLLSQAFTKQTRKALCCKVNTAHRRPLQSSMCIWKLGDAWAEKGVVFPPLKVVSSIHRNSIDISLQNRRLRKSSKVSSFTRRALPAARGDARNRSRWELKG